MSVCPNCGSEYKRVTQHWAMSDCSYPEFTDKQWEILTGLLMGDGCVTSEEGRNPRFMVNMITKEYLEWLDNQFGILSTGVRHQKTPEQSAEQSALNINSNNCSDVYRWTTIRHPKLKELRDWYDSGKKVWPKSKLSPTAIKHLYVSDGSYEKYGSSNHIRIHLSNELENREEVSKMFKESGYPIQKWRIYNRDNRKSNTKKASVDFSVDVSEKIWKDIGKPLPGFEYKWPQGNIVHKSTE